MRRFGVLLLFFVYLVVEAARFDIEFGCSLQTQRAIFILLSEEEWSEVDCCDRADALEIIVDDRYMILAVI